ncbi:MAG: hypothetical protein GY754_03770 [bacterium]|nr:hypothetical protein [bacterium]
MEQTLTHIFDSNKTQLVQDFAHSRGWKFAYCAPAQFEEMGDLHGMPLEALKTGSNEYGKFYKHYKSIAW